VIASIESSPAVATTSEAEYVLPPDVIFLTVEDGSARLLDMAGGFHAMSAVGTRMLRETLANGAAAAVARIAEDYGVARQQVESDLTVFLRDLESQGLLRSRGSHRDRRSDAVGLARLLLRPAIHGTHRRLRSPEAKARALLGLARLSFAVFGWTPTVAAWRKAHAHFPVRQAGEGDAETICALDRSVRAAAASHLVAVACKERALCSWSLARAAGLHASIVVGVDLFPIAGHCWCEVGAHTLGDERERCDSFTPVARWEDGATRDGFSPDPQRGAMP
jgi:Transglutaminase-like superfamily/Coenzyme PQQ synthesis protein D (PqqD)